MLHPARTDTADYFAKIGGPGFDDVTGRPILFPVLPEYLPQIRARRALRGYLHESSYAVRAHEVIGRRRHVLDAGTLREIVGLDPRTRLILLLFDADQILERLWSDSPRLIPQVAQAGYDAVVAPSFSLWQPRPRTEILYNLKRSLVVFDLLQELGAPVIPRVAWEIDHDVHRAAEWLNTNRGVRLVAVDLMTYRQGADWFGQLAGLAHLDQLTERRLRYMVNGPSTLARGVDLYSCVEPERLSITNARVMAQGLDQDERRQLELFDGDPAGARFQRRVAAQRGVFARAAKLVASHRTGVHSEHSGPADAGLHDAA